MDKDHEGLAARALRAALLQPQDGQTMKLITGTPVPGEDGSVVVTPGEVKVTGGGAGYPSGSTFTATSRPQEPEGWMRDDIWQRSKLPAGATFAPEDPELHALRVCVEAFESLLPLEEGSCLRVLGYLNRRYGR